MRKELTILFAVLAAWSASPLEAMQVADSARVRVLGVEVRPERADPVRAPLRLEVSLSERVLHVREGGEIVRSYRVAVGKPNHPTPRGEFRVRRVILNPRWVPPRAEWARGKTPKEPGEPGNPMGKAKIFFREPDYYIHGTSEEESLGRAASHGCIRMANDDVVELARLVMKHGGEPRDPGWFQRVLNRVRSSQEVRLSEPVVLVVKE